VYARIVGQKVGTIYAVCNAQGRCEFMEFVQRLETEGQNKKIAAIMAVLQDYLQDPRKRFTTNVRRDIRSVEGAWEFRRKDIRLLCFNGPPSSIIISHAYEKRSNDPPKKELSKLKLRFSEYKINGMSVWKDGKK